MPNYDRIDLMNFVRYGNDIDEQWDEIRNYIKSNAGAQREVEEIRKSIPQSSQAARKKMESFEQQTFTSKPQSPSPAVAKPGEAQGSQEKSQKWWNKILGDE